MPSQFIPIHLSTYPTRALTLTSLPNPYSPPPASLPSSVSLLTPSAIFHPPGLDHKSPFITQNVLSCPSLSLKPLILMSISTWDTPLCPTKNKIKNRVSPEQNPHLNPIIIFLAIITTSTFLAIAYHGAICETLQIGGFDKAFIRQGG